MAQFEPLPIGDILKGIDSESYSDPTVNPGTDALPTKEDILSELRGGQGKQPGDQIQSQGGGNCPRPRQAEPLVDTEEFVETPTGEIAETVPSVDVSAERETPSPVSSSSIVSAEDLVDIQAGIASINQNVSTLADSSIKITGEVREMHKLYHNEYASRLKSMQDELERYREIDKGRIFDGILGEVAKLYSDYESVVDDVTDEKVKKRIRYMLEDIIQILQANGVQKQKSNCGDKRNTRHCQVIERIPTSDPEQHDTVAKSRGTGFYIENRSLIKEPVDIYLYSEAAEEKSDQI